MPQISNRTLLIVSFVIFLTISLYFAPNLQSGNIVTLLSTATFIYATYTAFTVANSITRHSRIKETLKQVDAGLLNIHWLSEVYDDKTRAKIKRLIDDHLMAQIDYQLYDFKHSFPSFQNLSRYLMSLPHRNPKEELAVEKMVDVVIEINNQRKLLEPLVRETISRSEWAIVLILQTIILICLFLINDGSWISVATNTLLATTSVFILITIRNFNNLSWKEEFWVWESLEELFVQLDLPPYFPDEVLINGRAKPKIGRTVRIATYTQEYPSVEGKKVKLEKITKGRT